MTMALFADVSSIYPAVRNKFKAKVDYGKILNAFEGVYRSFAYGIQVGNEANSFITALRHLNFTTKFKRLRQGENWSLELALDVIRLSKRFHTIIVVSNDLGLIPLYQWCRENGIYVCVVACEHADELSKHVDCFYPLDETFMETPNERIEQPAA